MKKPPESAAKSPPSTATPVAQIGSVRMRTLELDRITAIRGPFVILVKWAREESNLIPQRKLALLPMS